MFSISLQISALFAHLKLAENFHTLFKLIKAIINFKILINNNYNYN